MGIAVGTLGRNLDASSAVAFERTRRFEDRFERVSEERVAVVNEMLGIAQEPIDRIGEVASNLLHPLAVWIDANACDLDLASLELNHEEDRVANGSEDSQNLDVEEVTCVETVPMRPHELIPSPLLLAFRSGNDADPMEYVGDGVAADVDLQTFVHDVADLGVTPGEVLLGEPDDQIPNLFGLGRPALLSR